MSSWGGYKPKDPPLGPHDFYENAIRPILEACEISVYRVRAVKIELDVYSEPTITVKYVTHNGALGFHHQTKTYTVKEEETE